MKKCLNCGKEVKRGKLSGFHWARKKYCCRRCQANHNRRKTTEEARAYYLKIKRKSICGMCGWKEHPEVLAFHHTIKKIKKGKRKDFLGSCNYVSEVLSLLKKGVFLCPNCHTWLHYVNEDFFTGRK